MTPMGMPGASQEELDIVSQQPWQSQNSGSQSQVSQAGGTIIVVSLGTWEEGGGWVGLSDGEVVVSG